MSVFLGKGATHPFIGRVPPDARATSGLFFQVPFEVPN